MQKKKLKELLKKEEEEKEEDDESDQPPSENSSSTSCHPAPTLVAAADAQAAELEKAKQKLAKAQAELQAANDRLAKRKKEGIGKRIKDGKKVMKVKKKQKSLKRLSHPCQDPKM